MYKPPLYRGGLWFLSALLMTVVYFRLSPTSFHLNFVDAGAYASAIRRWMSGQDPYLYTPDMGMYCLYPPVFIYLGGTLARLFTPHLGWVLYQTLHIAAALSLPWILYRHYLKKSSIGLAVFYLLFFASPGFLGSSALETGNIAIICYAAMLSAGIRGLRLNRWTLFYLAVFCCSSIKITFLPMLLLPLLCGEGKFLSSAGCAVATVCGLLAQRWIAPSLYSRFTQNLQMQGMRTGEVGRSLFGIFFHILHSLNGPGLLIIPMLAYGSAAIAIIAVLGTLRTRGAKRLLPSWYALVLAGVLFAMPRLEYYDLCIVFPLTFCIFIDTVVPKYPTLLYLFLSIPSLYFLVRTADKATNGGVEALAILLFWGWSAYRLLTITVSAQPVDAGSSNESIGSPALAKNTSTVLCDVD